VATISILGNGAMTVTENIFFTWALFIGGVTLVVAALIWLFNWAKRSRLQ